MSTKQGREVTVFQWRGLRGSNESTTHSGPCRLHHHRCRNRVCEICGFSGSKVQSAKDSFLFFFFRKSADSKFQITTVTSENIGFKGSDGGRVCAQHIRISWLLFLYTTMESKGPPAVSVYRHHRHREPREPLVVFRLFLVVRFGLAVDCSLSVSCILLIHNICGPKPGWALCYSCALRNDRMFLLRYTGLRTTCTVHST
jgi:hypothetical protein